MAILQQRSEETRTRILETALAAFSANGYDTTGVAEICRRARVSKGAFYYHFSSKQDLFLALLQYWLHGVDLQLEVSRDQATTVPDELKAMAGMAHAVFRDASGQLPMFLEFWTKAARDPLVWQETIAPYHYYRDLFAGMIERGIADGSLEQLEPETGARIVLALAIGLLLQGLLDAEATDWGCVAETGMALLLDGMARR